MNIQTETAIVPFTSAIQPVRYINPKILRYSEGNKYSQDQTALTNADSDQSVGNIYGRLGKAAEGSNSIGENIDIYI
jgi:hypothetical protein